MSDITNYFNDIYDKTYKNTLIHITSKCSNIHDIEDILQETYTELYRTLLRKGIDYVQAPERLVIKISNRKIYKHYSLKEKIQGISLNTSNENDAEIINFIPDDLIIEDAICTKEALDSIRAFVLSKPLIVQKIFLLYYSYNLTIPRIALLLCVNESYVKNKLYRTLKEIKNLYRGEEQ
ncbi:MAG: sigma-70 family RNA polymerase sigma factor [Ruminococcaceae bacterium]|nr:sigma-70 family RNA polymerase sigma factor [Oscillospiraceae bacterium]